MQTLTTKSVCALSCIAVGPVLKRIRSDQINNETKHTCLEIHVTDVHIAGDCSGDSDDVNDVNHPYMFDYLISS